MKKICITIIVSLALSCASCSFVWDHQAQNDAKVALIAITVSSRVRQDPNPPKREDAYRAAQTILTEFIESGNTDSQYLSSRLYQEFVKIFSPAVSSALVATIMADIETLAQRGDPASVLAAETTVRDGIAMGLTPRPVPVTSSKK